MIRAPESIVGKYTLLDQLYAPGAMPIHTKSDDVLVSQYGHGTEKSDHRNDCGPACVLMALKAMGVEQKFKELIDPKNPAGVTVKDELDKIRYYFSGTTGDYTMSPSDVRRALSAVLEKLGVPAMTPAQWAAVMPMLNEETGGVVNQKNDADPKSPDFQAAEHFIDRHCTTTSAVIVFGQPTTKAWGWGGDKGLGNVRSVGDDYTGKDGLLHHGDHFVFVWRVDPHQESYDVLDPSWTAPKRDVPIDKIMSFIFQAGMAIGVFAVPLAQLAGSIGAKHGDRPYPRIDLKDIPAGGK